jgi:prepilin-type N-terminal cleavage/methylation domain-containing protein
MNMNITKLKERGFSLVEVLVATAILSVTVIGFLTFVEDNRKSLNSANERTDFQNMAMKFKQYFDSPNRCKDFFDATAGIGNHFTIDMTAAMDADNNNAFSNSILLKNYNFEEMTLIKSHLPSNPFTDGTMVDGDIESFFIKIGVKASRNQVHKSFSGDTRDLFKRYFTMVFHLKREAGIATLDGCHKRPNMQYLYR